ncbi:MAG: saccharopine dehydrogenase C-terminal domain-containing protein [Bacteroidota bacterium]
MNNILIIGAGRSSYALIDYVIKEAAKSNWFVTVADANPDVAKAKIKDYKNARAIWLDVSKNNDRKDHLMRTDAVVSLLPAHLHLEVAHDCIKFQKPCITSSYVSREMYRLGDEARDRELVFTGERSLDPGLEHIAAKKRLDDIRAQGGKLTAFRSYGGGLVTPDSLQDNPWKFKFTWNPRNLVLMGQGTAQYLEKGKKKYIPYHRLFQSYKTVNIEGVGEFEAYANRDSLLYKDIYGLQDIPSIYRATLRYPGFCDGWNALVQIGLTDGSYPILDSEKMSFHEWMEAYLVNESGGSVKERMANKLGVTPFSKVMKQLEWLGLFSKRRIKFSRATPALLLETVLMDKWSLTKKDRDVVLMQHEYDYILEGERKTLISTLEVKGEDHTNTALAKVVGLPMAIMLRKVLNGEVNGLGMGVPMEKYVYDPLLAELEEYGIVFKDKHI